MKRLFASQKEKNEFIVGWAFILPTVLGLLILNIIPLIKTIYESFFRTGAFGKGNIFIGLDNYKRLFADKEVWQAIVNTFKYAIVEVPLAISIAIVIAVLLNRKMKGRTVFRTIFFLPMVAAPAAVAMVWKWLYNSQFGLLNYVRSLFNQDPVNWLSNPKIAIIFLALVGVWSAIGYNMVLFLAGLQEIPKDYYEAATIDGAGGFTKFFKITLPLISPTMFFVLVTKVIGSLQVFDAIYMMIDRANPALEKTQSLVYLFYKHSFIQSEKGYGSTIVVLLLIIILIITALQMYGQKKWVHYE
ncbi:sugar ABC transporter permease [Clostridium sp. AL.422]|uniref:carbohydrate ABC transporter permease n=1 Tax=Clostridium TaxID=1485 RepID=UPI00293DA7C7|nr:MULTISPECIES: sugar ABC transporter permease [unclassified Clostridium]MDV4152131.1 sugar ABC transporter permease [Clostridium sp. AL.422]